MKREAIYIKRILFIYTALKFINLQLSYFLSLSKRTADTIPQFPLGLGLRHFAVFMLRRYSSASENVAKRF